MTQPTTQDLIDAAPAMYEALVQIGELANAPHWTADRRWKIANLAASTLRQAHATTQREAREALGSRRAARQESHA